MERRLGVETADAVWAVAEGWAGDALGEGDNWRVQLVELLCGKVEVNWVRGHVDKRTTRRMMRGAMSEQMKTAQQPRARGVNENCHVEVWY